MANKMKIKDNFSFSKIQLIHKINSLEDIIKDELFKTFMEKLQEPSEISRLRKENKNLRAKNKTLKSLLRGEK
jgi:hypothetical protein